MAKTGRPSSGQHTVGFLIKLTDSDNDLLLELAKRTGESKSNVLRFSLRAYKEQVDNNKK